MTHEVERRKKVEKIFIIQLYDGRIKRISVAGYFSQSQLAMRFFKDQTNINASNITHHIILCTLDITFQNYKFLVIALNVMWSKAYQWVVNFMYQVIISIASKHENRWWFWPLTMCYFYIFFTINWFFITSTQVVNFKIKQIHF